MTGHNPFNDGSSGYQVGGSGETSSGATETDADGTTTVDDTAVPDGSPEEPTESGGGTATAGFDIEPMHVVALAAVAALLLWGGDS